MVVDLVRIAWRDASKRRGLTVFDALITAAVTVVGGTRLGLKWQNAVILGLVVGFLLFGIQFAQALAQNLRGQSREWEGSYNLMGVPTDGAELHLYLHSRAPFAPAQPRLGHHYACVIRNPNGGQQEGVVGVMPQFNGVVVRLRPPVPSGRFQVLWYSRLPNDKLRPELVQRFRLSEDEIKSALGDC